MALLSISSQAASFTTGDVFAAVGGGLVKEFTPQGTLVQTLNDGSGTTYTTGMAFDASGNLLVTNFNGTVSKFNSNGTLASTNFLTGGPATAESVVVNGAGNFIVGGPSGANFGQFASTGGLPTVIYSVQGGNGTGGTDWADLAADQRTLYYDGEGTVIRRYDLVTKTQLSDFGSAPNASVYAFRLIPSGTFAGDLVAADSSQAILFNSLGSVIKTYTLPGNGGGDFALNLDPNGTDFWTSDSNTGKIWEVNLATGAIDSQFFSGDPGTTFGLVVAGEITAAGPTNTPEPASVGLFVMGAVAFGLAARKRKSFQRAQ